MSSFDSREKYVGALRQGLPGSDVDSENRRETAFAKLSHLAAWKFEQVCPDPGESLANWIMRGFAENHMRRLTMVVGETRNRPQREDVSPDQPCMTAAATSDGVAAFDCALSIIKHLASEDRNNAWQWLRLSAQCIVDEWVCEEGTRLDSTHIISIGSPEVNLVSLFLHGMVPSFHYGTRDLPPDLNTMADWICWGTGRGRRGGDFGAILLLKNPWDPKYRILWLSGLTGRATHAAAGLAVDFWSEYRSQLFEQLSGAIGVVFQRHENKVAPLSCLAPHNGGFRWREVESPIPIRLTALAGETRPESSVNVFISYSHKDNNWRRRLETHLRPYVRNGTISCWSDHDIVAGVPWKEEIRKALASARVAVLLVSPDFIASDFIANEELPQIISAAENTGLKIVWVPISDCAWPQTAIAGYQAAWEPSRPLAGLKPHQRDTAFVQICSEILGSRPS